MQIIETTSINCEPTKSINAARDEADQWTIDFNYSEYKISKFMIIKPELTLGLCSNTFAAIRKR